MVIKVIKSVCRLYCSDSGSYAHASSVFGNCRHYIATKCVILPTHNWSKDSGKLKEFLVRSLIQIKDITVITEDVIVDHENEQQFEGLQLAFSQYMRSHAYIIQFKIWNNLPTLHTGIG